MSSLANQNQTNKEEALSVLFMVAHFPVLSETFILNQITGLINRGHSVDICALHGLPLDYTDKQDISIKKYNLASRLVYPLEQKTFSCTFKIPTYKDIRILLNTMRNGGTFRNPILGVYIRKIVSISFKYKNEQKIDFNKKEYDIIHCQFGTLANQTIGHKRSGLIAGKIIVHFRGKDISEYIRRKGNDIYSKTFEYADYFLTNCNEFKRRAIELGCNEREIEVHRSGLDCTKFVFNPKSFPSQETLQLVTVGRLVEKKGIRYAIEAVQKVSLEYPAIQYTIVGNGELREELEKYVKELGCQNKIRFTGWKDHSEIVEILNHSHICISPNITASNGDTDAPTNTIREALAIGLPVISTFLPSIMELIEDNRNGLLVEERNSNAITEKILHLIKNPEIWAPLTQAGRLKVEEEYDSEKLNDELVEIYRDVIRGIKGKN